ncbi:PaaI family thioesterase [Corynebacterium confusum]|uniref:PaaI family thioesterase n=1 Tax=Corynebacterium confusum TaxID=71254 RepID=UPI0025B62062|nr:PaaI family thioesterase [Corynebacterium confusum]WJY89710.1 Putative esterase [Corynebacterium confusum]
MSASGEPLNPTHELEQLLYSAHETALDDSQLATINRQLTGLDATLGITYTAISNGEVRATMAVDARHHQPWGVANGGVYACLTESVASVAGVVAARRPVVGVNNNTDFLRPASSGTLTATATPLHLGRRTQLWGVDICDEQGRLMARSQLRTMPLGG